jgi:hypothetical protein
VTIVEPGAERVLQVKFTTQTTRDCIDDAITITAPAYIRRQFISRQSVHNVRLSRAQECSQHNACMTIVHNHRFKPAMLHVLSFWGKHQVRSSTRCTSSTDSCAHGSCEVFYHICWSTDASCRDGGPDQFKTIYGPMQANHARLDRESPSILCERVCTALHGSRGWWGKDNILRRLPGKLFEDVNFFTAMSVVWNPARYVTADLRFV